MDTKPNQKPFTNEVTSEKQRCQQAHIVPMSEPSTVQRAGLSGRTPFKVLLCASDASDGLCSALREILERASELSRRVIEVVRGAGGNPGQLASRTKATDPDLVFLFLAAPRPAQLVPLFQALRSNFAGRPLIIVTDGMDAAELCALLRLGASDFLTTPLRRTDVLPRLIRLIDQTWRGDPLVQGLKEKLGLKQIIGESPALLREIQKIPQMARCDATVLISGETGTGKEVIARSVHYLSPRADQPFVAVNCGAIPVDLIENELFGHESGAFTSATTPQAGVIQEADRGTLFLDEIDALSLQAQVKLLRFLQEKEYRPLGGPKTRRIDTRVIAASSVNFEEALHAGRFRQDLYYRLNVLPIILPPLRNRREDIPLLARHFVEKYSAEFHLTPGDITPGAMEKLLVYPWPGNVRELENVVQRAMLLCQSATIQPKDVLLPGVEPNASGQSFQALKHQAVAEFERRYLQAVLLEHHGNISAAARASQKNRRAFWELLRKHDLLQRNTCYTDEQGAIFQ